MNTNTMLRRFAAAAAIALATVNTGCTRVTYRGEVHADSMTKTLEMECNICQEYGISEVATGTWENYTVTYYQCENGAQWIIATDESAPSWRPCRTQIGYDMDGDSEIDQIGWKTFKGIRYEWRDQLHSDGRAGGPIANLDEALAHFDNRR